jgi:hypothetical protein
MKDSNFITHKHTLKINNSKTLIINTSSHIILTVRQVRGRMKAITSIKEKETIMVTESFIKKDPNIMKIIKMNKLQICRALHHISLKLANQLNNMYSLLFKKYSQS